MNWNKRKHTAFALTSSAVSDGGRFTRQFFRGTRATSAVAEGFLGAIVRRYGMNRKRRDCVIFKTRRSKGLDKSQHRTPPDQLDSAIKCPPECSSPSRPAASTRTEAYSAPRHVASVLGVVGGDVTGRMLSPLQSSS